MVAALLGLVCALALFASNVLISAVLVRAGSGPAGRPPSRSPPLVSIA
jgi:hypothetical protein